MGMETSLIAVENAVSETCPYCRSAALRRRELFERDYLYCADCSLGAMAGLGDASIRAEMAQYYERDYFELEAWDQLQGHRQGLFGHILDEIESGRSRGSLLDVGCGCGHLLREALSRGWRVQGVDPSSESVAHLRSLVGDVGFEGTLETYRTGVAFDVVTLINVLDHVAEPWKELERAAALLKPGGLLYLRIPNGPFHTACWQAMKGLGLLRIARRYVIVHAHALGAAFMRRLLGRLGFSAIRVTNAHPSALTDRTGVLPYRFNRVVRRLAWAVIHGADVLSGGRALLAPTLTVFAVKNEMAPAGRGPVLRQGRWGDDGARTCAGSAER
jgi:2-polyprenyl-3-methyl-5-hydroxy-6-metoxy-1,4-benzoquinol methylase